jgi:hypothetical protein
VDHATGRLGEADALWNGHPPASGSDDLVRVLARAGRARRWWRWLAREASARPRPSSRGSPADILDDLIAWAQAALQLRRAQEQLGNDLGVVTPFAAQARLLRSLLQRRVDRHACEELRLRVGTAHTFQGAERDVMLFSTVVADGVPAGTIGWLEKNRYLVNVAVSRACLALVVFGDARHLSRLGAPTLAALHEHTRSRAHRETQLSDAETALLACLATDVDVRVGATVADHPAPGSILTSGAATLVVAVDAGQADGAARLRELAPDQNMIAAGARVLRIPAWLCRSDPEAAVQMVLAAPRPSSRDGSACAP